MLIDNVTTKVVDIFVDKIEQGDEISILTGLFSIYAYNHLKDSLNEIELARILFSQAKGLDAFDSESPFGTLNGTSAENKYRNKLTQKAVARDFANCEPPRYCRRLNILREYDNEKTNLHS